jgi:hypothetical protein
MIQVTLIFLIPFTTVTIELPLPTPVQGQIHLAISLFPRAFARIQANLILGGMEITYDGQLGRHLEAENDEHDGINDGWMDGLMN